MDTPHAFRNYVKATLNHGLCLSEVDWGFLKRELTRHGPRLMELDWGGKLKPNHISSGCMLSEVDWGGKLGVNYTSECMLSEVDWGAHETHPNGHSITEVDWGGHDPSFYPMDGCMLSEVHWGAHDSSPNHMNRFLLSKVDWGGNDSSFFLYLMYIEVTSSLKDYGENYHKEHLPPLSSTGQAEDGFFNFKSMKGYRSSYSLPDPEQHESSYNHAKLIITSRIDVGLPATALGMPVAFNEKANRLHGGKRGMGRVEGLLEVFHYINVGKANIGPLEI